MDIINIDLPDPRFVELWVSGVITSNTISITLQKWTHIVIVSNSVSPYLWAIYKNGVSLDSKNGISGGNFKNIFLARSEEGYRPLNGALRDVFAYNRILSASEINTIYNSSPLYLSSI